jgi:non-structural maintenance of chromosomes element 4
MARIAQVVSRGLEETSQSRFGRGSEATRDPAASPSYSDKENRPTSNNSLRRGKRKSGNQAMPPPSQRGSGPASSTSKRRRLAEVSSNTLENGSQSAIQSPTRRNSNKFYDPDQDENERRRVKKELRDLTRDLHGTTSLKIRLCYYLYLTRLF